MSADPGGDAERARFEALLEQAAAAPRKTPFWWRDDDAEDATPALDKLLALADRHGLPVGLAVIPKGATPALAETLVDHPRAAVLQHGWQHANHSPPGEKKMELGEHRPLDAILDELSQGFNRLRPLFPQRFLPVLVPPWNRIARSVLDQRTAVGLPGFSGFGPAPKGAPHWVNTHVDIMDWQTRDALARAEAFAKLSSELERRLANGDGEPIGILTHHLVHTDAGWELLDEVFGLIAHHEVAVWPDMPTLFALEVMGAEAE